MARLLEATKVETATLVEISRIRTAKELADG
jgi:hypothetical protein